MSVAILGLGTAVPDHTMSQEQATTMACDICCTSERQRKLLNVLYRKSGVRKRHTVVPYTTAYDWLAPRVQGEEVIPADPEGPSTQARMDYYAEHALPLAEEAAAKAVAAAEGDPTRITHLICVTCTGFVAPGVDIHLIQRLGLRPTTERVHVGFMGCHGAINGLRVARAIVAADPSARVLLCAVELCSLHYRFQWDPERFLGNVLFADGAAAMVLAAAELQPEAWQVRATGSCVFPNSTEAMTWRVGNHGFEMTLSSQVPELIGRQLRPWLASWLEQQGLDLSAVGSWAVHPGGPRILTSVEESLDLDRGVTAVSHQVLAEYGNMSSPTVLFILERLQQSNPPGPCVMLGFGPGLVAEIALIG